MIQVGTVIIYSCIFKELLLEMKSKRMKEKLRMERGKNELKKIIHIFVTAKKQKSRKNAEFSDIFNEITQAFVII